MKSDKSLLAKMFDTMEQT